MQIRLHDTINSFLRASGLVLFPAGVAVLLAAMPVDALGADQALAVRAAFFVFLTLLLLRLGVWELWQLTMRPDAARGVYYLTALLPCVLVARLSAIHPSSVLAPSFAATAEEVVYRAALPEAIRRTVRSSSNGFFRIWQTYSLAQFSFGFGHLAISGGFHTMLDLQNFIGLVSAGCFLAGVRIVAGLPTAAAMHALVNVVAATGMTRLRPTSWLVVSILFVIAFIHQWVAIRSREQKPSRPSKHFSATAA